MQEQVIVVIGIDGDILNIIRPSDPINPRITIDEIERHGDCEAIAYPVNSIADFLRRKQIRDYE